MKTTPDVPKSGLNLGFLPFGLLVFPENAYSDSLQQCLTSSRGKIYKKKISGHKCGPKGPKSGLKLGFFPFFQVLFISFPLNCTQ